MNNIINLVVDVLLIPTIFAQTRLHDFVENVTPQRRGSGVRCRANKATDEWSAATHCRIGECRRADEVIGVVDEEVFLGADGYGRGPCDGTIPIPENIYDVA